MTEEYDDSDLYDDIFCQEEDNIQSGDIEDLYENIHNPQVAETALEKVKTLTSENDKLKSQNTKLKDQIRILQDLNGQLTTTNSTLQNNIKQLIETARTEINRKNTEIIDRQSKLEDVLFRRAARNLTSRELESIMEKFSLRNREDSLKRLSTNLNKMKTVSKNSPDLTNVANRQFVRKKRAVSPETETSQSKRTKFDDECELTEKVKVKVNEENSSVSNEKEKTLNTDIGLISNYVKVKERKKKVKESPKLPDQTKQVPEVKDQNEKKQKAAEQPRWFCDLHNEGFRVREDLREHNKVHHSKDERERSGSGSECGLPPPPVTVDSKDDKENDKTESSGIIRIPVNTELSNNGNMNKTEDTLSEGYKSGDDILEIDTVERFDEEDSSSQDHSNVYFKSLETNFNIPKVSSADKKVPDLEKRSEKEKEKKSSAPGDKRRERKSRRESSSGERDINKSRGRGRSSSRSRRRKPRSASRSRRRSKSRQRRGEKTADDRRKTSSERGRGKEKEDWRRRRSSSRRRRRSPRSTSREKRKRSPKRSERRTRLARRSQSLSPSRLEEMDIDQVEIKEDLSLEELKKIKEKIKGKMGLNDDLEPVRAPEPEVEDGEVLSEDEDGKQDDRERKIQDLRQKLSKDSNSPVIVTKQSEVSVDTGYRASSSPLIPNISQEIKACLQDYSAEDIDKKLIPFKKRQFNELQFEETKLKKQIENARSKSNTPRRLSDSSDNLRSSPPLMISTSPAAPEDEEEGEVEDAKKVSPLKLSLRGVVIQQPSSSSSSADTMAERVTVTSHTQSDLRQDDNARFPTVNKELTDLTPNKNILDVSQDLTLTDDSDLETSPVKKKKTSRKDPLKTPVAKVPKESPSFDSVKKLPLTPKENLSLSSRVDISSPKGISELLKSPLISHSLLATSSPVSKSDENTFSAPGKRKKKKLQLSRSSTTTN